MILIISVRTMKVRRQMIMNNTSGFEFIETVEYSDTGRFSLFKINGELYRIWHYTDCDTKYLQKVDVETDDIEEICEFH